MSCHANPPRLLRCDWTHAAYLDFGECPAYIFLSHVDQLVIVCGLVAARTLIPFLARLILGDVLGACLSYLWVTCRRTVTMLHDNICSKKIKKKKLSRWQDGFNRKKPRPRFYLAYPSPTTVTKYRTVAMGLSYSMWDKLTILVGWELASRRTNEMPVFKRLTQLCHPDVYEHRSPVSKRVLSRAKVLSSWTQSFQYWSDQTECAVQFRALYLRARPTKRCVWSREIDA